jgi:hypothetical protein
MLLTLTLKVEPQFVLPGVHTEFFAGGGGADLQAMYNLCFILKTMLQKSCHYLPLHLYTYKYNYMFHDSITVSNLLVFFLILFILQNSNVPVISQFQWLVSAEG